MTEKNRNCKYNNLKILKHPAYLAWNKLKLSKVKPQRIELMKNQRGRSFKRNIYRLHGVNHQSSPVIAKICGKKSGLREKTIYEEILRYLPVNTPRFYGLVVEHNSNNCWIFLEDVRGEEYSLKNPVHRSLAATWLGSMHTSAEQFTETVCLPDRGPEHYKDQMQIARKIIGRNIDNNALNENDRMILQTILSHFNKITSLWYKIDDFCKDMPRTLIHGDLVAKNVRVRQTDNTLALFTLDWGTTAGWGPPAVDLAQFVGQTISPDLAIYQSIVSQDWPNLKLCYINQLAEIGKIFRLIISIKWASESLAYEWVEESMGNLKIYENDLKESVKVI